MSGEKDFVISFVGKRDEGTYRDVEAAVDGRSPLDLDRLESLNEVSAEGKAEEEACKSKADSLPGYELQHNRSLVDFLETDYAAYARLTPEQREIFNDLKRDSRRDRSVLLVQGSAGTGKTVGAMLTALEWEGSVLFLAPESVKALLESRKQRSGVSEVRIQTPTEFWNTAAPEVEYCPQKALEVLLSVASASQRKQITSEVMLALELPEADRKDAFGQDMALRMAGLKDILPHWRKQLRRPFVTRTERAKNLQRAYLDEFALVVVDEVQDWMIEELVVLRECLPNATPLWLFGDLNQRLSPSGFWPAGLTRRIEGCYTFEMKRNYRNHAAVLEAAVSVHGEAKRLTSEAKGRHLPEPGSPEDAVVKGGVASWSLLTPELRGMLHEEHRMASTLYETLQRSVPLLSSQPSKLSDVMGGGVSIIDARKAKGAEYESCILVHPFPSGAAAQTLEDVFHAYVLVTRARSSVLLLLNEEERDVWKERGLLDGWTKEDDPGQRLREMEQFGNVVDIEAQADHITKRLLQGNSDGKPWPDSFRAIQDLLRFKTDVLDMWERKWHPHLKASPLPRTPHTPNEAWLFAQTALARKNAADAPAVLDAMPLLKEERAWKPMSQRFFNLYAPQGSTLADALGRNRLAVRLGVQEACSGTFLSDVPLDAPLAPALAKWLMSQINAALS